jgi:hypothetical protein
MTIPTRRPADEEDSESIGCLRIELSLDAMLEDEIVRLTMASDGVSSEEVLALREIVPLLSRQAA